MQEDIEQKTIALSVRIARMTSIVLQQALRRFLDAQKLPHGKQTLKELMKQNTGVSSLEVNYDNIKDIEATAKKYGIDFALWYMPLASGSDSSPLGWLPSLLIIVLATGANMIYS